MNFRAGKSGSTNCGRSNFGFDAAGAHDAPSRYRLKHGKQTRHHQHQSEPQHIVHDDDARDEAQCADDPARQAAAVTDIRLEKTIHGGQSSTSRA